VSLSEGWRFRFGDVPEAVKATGFDDSGWEVVSVPHTWNRIGEYSLTRSAATNNKQGNGWYRLTYNAPLSAKGRRQYLDFAAVAIIADVWVNGLHVGQHKGAFSRFRFDVTSAWKPGAANLIVVKADNSKPAPGSSTEHVLPLAGDFFQHGGMYRGVSLIEANDVGIDLLDFGGPGVYVSGQNEEFSGRVGNGLITVKARFLNASAKAAKADWAVILRDAEGKSIPAKTDTGHRPPDLRGILVLNANANTEFVRTFSFPILRKWNGTADPYMYSLTMQLRSSGKLVDSFTQPIGIRTFRFDAVRGFHLNPSVFDRDQGYLKLKGVSRHQDRLGKGYALTREDHAEDMKIIREMGANSVRQAHYQHADEWSDEADKAGMVVWAEVPFVTTPSFTGGEGSAELFANAEQQTRELIRQNYNHPSIVMWSVGNEVDASTLFGVSKEPVKPLKLLQYTAKIAKEEDPTRPTIFADCCEDVRLSSMAGTEKVDAGTDKLAGAADMIGYNRYYGWYYPQPLKAAEQLAAQMDRFHLKHPTLPISISEYGAGGATGQHSDNPTSGFVNAIGRPQPDEYESWVHEQSWPVIRDRPFIFGSYVWNMFDFASDLRNEGDSVDINTKGLVTFDRKTKKDAFYYYQANWSNKPMIHLTGKNYRPRSYTRMDVKAYTNANTARLTINGIDMGEASCPERICIWPMVPLKAGPNEALVTAGTVSDSANWFGPNPAEGIHINAGDIARSEVNGWVFGSDNFVTGGTPAVLNQGGFGGRGAPRKTVTAPDPALYDYWREGDAYSYAVPMPNGKWKVTIHTFEPRESGSGKMTISANGKVALLPFSLKDTAGGPLKGVAKSFPVLVKNGVLTLDFTGSGGKAVVAAFEITK
jgi:beta-galactosidase